MSLSMILGDLEWRHPRAYFFSGGALYVCSFFAYRPIEEMLTRDLHGERYNTATAALFVCHALYRLTFQTAQSPLRLRKTYTPTDDSIQLLIFMSLHDGLADGLALLYPRP